MARLIASTAIARVLRRDCRLYSVSPTPTMQYLSLSDPMGVLAVDVSGVVRGPAESIGGGSAGQSRVRRQPSSPTLEQLDPDIVGRLDEGDPDARTNRARLHREAGASAFELGHGVVHVLHAQPEVVQADVGLR